MTDHSQIYVYVSRVRDHSHICVYVSRGQPSRRYNQVTARRRTPEVAGSHQVQQYACMHVRARAHLRVCMHVRACTHVHMCRHVEVKSWGE